MTREPAAAPPYSGSSTGTSSTLTTSVMRVNGVPILTKSTNR